MWSPNELLKIEKQRDILSYITLQFFHFKKVPLEHCPFVPSFHVSPRTTGNRCDQFLWEKEVITIPPNQRATDNLHFH